jgi:hypothetical protein
VIWTVTANGTTLKAFASLRPDYMIDVNVISANRGAQRDTDPVNKNTPPTITEAPKDQTISLGTPLALTVAVTDDGMPIPRERGSGRGEAGTNLKQLLRATWLQWRGETPGCLHIGSAGMQSFETAYALWEHCATFPNRPMVGAARLRSAGYRASRMLPGTPAFAQRLVPEKE